MNRSASNTSYIIEIRKVDSHPGFRSAKERSNILKVSHPEVGQQLPVKEITGTQWTAIEKMYFPTQKH